MRWIPLQGVIQSFCDEEMVASGSWKTMDPSPYAWCIGRSAVNERRHSPSARARSGLDENLGRRDAEKRRPTFEWVGYLDAWVPVQRLCMLGMDHRTMLPKLLRRCSISLFLINRLIQSECFPVISVNSIRLWEHSEYLTAETPLFQVSLRHCPYPKCWR